MARYRRRVSGKFVASAVAAGLILAAAQGHGHAGSGGAAGATLTSADSNVALGQQMAASGYGWTGPSGPAWMSCGPGSPGGGWSGTTSRLRRLRHPAGAARFQDGLRRELTT